MSNQIIVMKKLLLVISAVLVFGTSAFAQEFFPGWQFGIKGGAGYTIGEAPFKNMLSAPQLGFDFGYQFTPTFTLRGDISGWNAKGALPAFEKVYKFNYAQFAADAKFDLCNMFGGYKARVVNPYLFAGIGFNYRFNNAEATELYNQGLFPVENYYWNKNTVSFLGRAGGGIDFRVSPAVSIFIEVVDNMVSDHFNNKKGDIFDYQVNGFLGVKFSFGQAKKAKAAAAAAAAAEAEAARLVAERAAAEAAAKAAAEKAAAEKAAAEAAERAAAEQAAAEAARAAARSTTEDILFLLNKYEIRDAEQNKIDDIVKIMKEYPEATLTVSGYADKSTGKPKYNMELSKKRAEIVTQAIIAAGIDPSRITTEYFGDEVNPFPTPEENRVSVCVTK